MKPDLPAIVAAILAPLALAPAGAQPMTVRGVLTGPLFPQPGSGSLYPSGGSLYPTPIPGEGAMHTGGFHRGWGHGFGRGFVIFEEPRVVHDVVVVHDVAPEPPAPPPPPPPPRKPYVIGRSYASLPGGCMKMIAGGASYYQCSGEWYRQVAGGYRAVAGPAF